MEKFEGIFFSCTAGCARCFKRRYVLYLMATTLISGIFWSTGYDDRNLEGGQLYHFTCMYQDTTLKPQMFNAEKTVEDILPVIIRWNNFRVNPDLNITCKAVRCLMTNNRELRHRKDILAIMFYGSHVGYGGLPLPRKPGHLWSVMHDESPKNNDWLFTARGAMSLFNLTGTFKREAHYSFPTMWLRNEKKLTSMEFVVSVQEKNQYRSQGFAPVVYVHSDCDVPSDRDHYMRLLQQYIPIDSYGLCEHNKNFPVRNMSGMTLYGSSDFYRFIAKYKFAFAFENVVCDDYITEKFWRPLQLGVVPLVFGSSKIKDFAPSDHSIIDIRDFQTVSELAEYITFLDSNDDQYSKYLDFKQSGITNHHLRVHLEQRDWGHGHVYSSRFDAFECFVCEKLHTLQNKVFSGEPIELWHGKDDHYSCPAAKSFDEKGRYMIDTDRRRQVAQYAEYYLESLRYHIDNNKNADATALHRFAKNLQRKDRRKKLRQRKFYEKL